MKYFPVLLAACCLAGQIRGEDSTATSLKTPKEKASYSIGVDMGKGMKDQRLDIDPELVMRGFRDAFSTNKTLLSETEMKSVLEQFEKAFQERMAKESAELPEKNKKEGEAFLAENAKKPGVKTHPVKLSDGHTVNLQYKVLREGSGASPTLDDKVTTHYRGTLIDGTEFDSSYGRNEPSTFTLRQVIKGWQEALQLMKPGAKWQLFVPSELAYGEQGAGRSIEPNATLIFDIELLSVEKP